MTDNEKNKTNQDMVHEADKLKAQKKYRAESEYDYKDHGKMNHALYSLLHNVEEEGESEDE